MNFASMFTSKISMFPEYQQQSGQQKKFDINFNTYLHPITVQSTAMFANNPFQRSFASVVSCKPPIPPKTNDCMSKRGTLSTNKDGIFNSFLKKIVNPKRTMLPSKIQLFEHSQSQKEFEDFKTLPSYLQNQRTASKTSSQTMHNSKNKHEKHRHSIEHDIRVDCDILNIKRVNSNPTNRNKQTNAMQLNTENLPLNNNIRNPPFEIYSLEEFPAIPTKTTSHDQTDANITANCSQKSDESDECDFVKFQDDIAKVTPSFIPRRYNLCEKVTNIVKSPKKLLNIPMMSPRRSCLKPTPRRRTMSECSDDYIVFDRSCCDESLIKENVDFEYDDEDESDLSDEEEDDDDGVVNDESGEDNIECDDYFDEFSANENSPEILRNDANVESQQPDSGMEERKVHFNLAPKIHVMIAWDHAYRQARRGDEWRQYAVDRERFAKRISECEKIINPILDKCHRNRIFEDRFQQ